jgi:hypothetical protein
MPAQAGILHRHTGEGRYLDQNLMRCTLLQRFQNAAKFCNKDGYPPYMASLDSGFRRNDAPMGYQLSLV